MSVVRRNIIANLIGGAWITILTVVMTPMQVNVLGIEAYGVVGFISTLQIAFTAFDLGLASTLTRELAADRSPGKQASNELVRTASTIYWAAAALIGGVLACLAGVIADRWFNATTLAPEMLEQSLRVIALYLALRWPVALYSGLLTGLQRMDVLNAVKAATTSLRLVGGLVVLLHWRSLYAFLIWTAFNALVEVVAFGVALRKVHPTMHLGLGVSLPELRRVWRFSVSMNVLSILAVLIVQLDRLFISKALPLESLGHYNLAYTAASAISFAVGAVSSAFVPALAAARSSGSAADLRDRYHRADRVMLTLVGAVTGVLVFFGEPVLAIWINPEAAASAARPLVWLACGFWCSAAIANVYNVAVASGMPGRHLRVNLLSFIPYALVLYALITLYGTSGAGMAWLLLNCAYGCLLVPPIQRHILGLSTTAWIKGTLLPFAALTVLCFGLASLAMGLYSPHPRPSVYGLAIALAFTFYGASVYRYFGFSKSEFVSIRSLLSRARP